MDSILISRFEKSAVDNGFDLVVGPAEGWLFFASSQCSLRVWLTTGANGTLLASFSQRNVVMALAGMGTVTMSVPPPGGAGVVQVADIPALHQLLRRSFQLSKSLPDELLHVFVARTATLPQTTEAERLVVQRVGQDIFRQGLLDYWEGRCAITGLAVPELLRASHIKPWAACETDAERLDVYNGLLLAPHLDAAFDQGFITVSDGGDVIVSPALDANALHVLGLETPTSVRTLLDSHRDYLRWHQRTVFRRVPDSTPAPVFLVEDA